MKISQSQLQTALASIYVSVDMAREIAHRVFEYCATLPKEPEDSAHSYSQSIIVRFYPDELTFEAAFDAATPPLIVGRFTNNAGLFALARQAEKELVKTKFNSSNVLQLQARLESLSKQIHDFEKSGEERRSSFTELHLYEHWKNQRREVLRKLLDMA